MDDNLENIVPIDSTQCRQPIELNKIFFIAFLTPKNYHINMLWLKIRLMTNNTGNKNSNTMKQFRRDKLINYS